MRSLESFSSTKEVTYSCGYCGYSLNLSSSYRNTENIGSKYGKAIRKGLVPFVSIDESRFGQREELRCMPYFNSKHSWGLFRKRTKLICRKCGKYIGTSYDEEDDGSAYAVESDDHKSSSTSSVSPRKKYVIMINALQPTSDDS
ncbi:methionine-S-oxide reductase [Rhynchospora pubera]|uniref:Methionine-S-oxide reductase n=1 Tax=Rhynchospora pubera TaxID=906938 RepID=A0AAV8FQZ0_9POAL|nr:methionine-S-oxide reductase [Rhynchospora pubera]KAJ4751102.1 methionine-S-oxide reductase [Rhynchospora pubera]KAJ4795949.1 methionine-S-oxide reductase [Rhynchospora pubera]